MKITENVYQLDCSKQSHVFLVKSDENVLIDTGMPGFADKILSELESLDIKPQSIKKILLTHHDIDHIGNVKRLQDVTGAEIWAPKDDIPYITGVKNRTGIKRIIQTLISVQKPSMINSYSGNHCFGDIRMIHAPGHTPGHTIIQYKNVVFIGDLINIKGEKFKLTPAFLNWNNEELKKSVSIIKELEYDWICPSHGDAIQKGTVSNEFLKKF